jgi:uncharacterized protein YggE
MQRNTNVHIYYFEYSSSRYTELIDLARAAAVADAMEQIASTAAASKIKVGDVLEIGWDLDPSQGFRSETAEMVITASKTVHRVPLEVGEIDIKEEIEVMVELLPVQ